MTQPVIYIHGEGSSGNTETAANLRNILADGYTVISPTYDCSAPLEAAEQLKALYAEHASTQPVIVGTSLGGFFANYLARVCNARAVIVNPSLTPSKSLQKYGETVETLAGYQRLEALELVQTNLPPRVVVIGMKDDVVDPRTNGLLLKNQTQTVLLEMGHRIEPAFYNTIAGLIRQLAVLPR
jgi:predicted esterase YcpF (UPF0227 family)